MKQEYWVHYSIKVHPNKKEVDEYGRWQPNHYHSHVLRSWHYPQWIVKKHDHFFHWVVAIYQVRFPKHHINTRYCAYIPETREMLTSKRQRSIFAAKAQLTKYENKIKLLQEYCAGTLFDDYTQHPIYPRLKSKLEEKKFNLNQAVMAAIEETI